MGTLCKSDRETGWEISVLWSECVSPSTFTWGDLNPQGGGVRRWAFGRRSGREGVALMNKTPQSSLGPPPREDTARRPWRGRRALARHQTGQHLDLRPPEPRAGLFCPFPAFQSLAFCYSSPSGLRPKLGFRKWAPEEVHKNLLILTTNRD